MINNGPTATGIYARPTRTWSSKLAQLAGLAILAFLAVVPFTGAGDGASFGGRLVAAVFLVVIAGSPALVAVSHYWSRKSSRWEPMIQIDALNAAPITVYPADGAWWRGLLPTKDAMARLVQRIESYRRAAVGRAAVYPPSPATIQVTYGPTASV